MKPGSPDYCEDSPDKKHEWVKDYEYDYNQPPTLCYHCGVSKKQVAEKNRILKEKK